MYTKSLSRNDEYLVLVLVAPQGHLLPLSVFSSTTPFFYFNPIFPFYFQFHSTSSTHPPIYPPWPTLPIPHPSPSMLVPNSDPVLVNMFSIVPAPG
jgi:hypothetical protein